jgi:hypothetical protein
MFHPSQQGFHGRALLPTPQENSLFVEQAGKPVLYNGAAIARHAQTPVFQALDETQLQPLGCE